MTPSTRSCFTSSSERGSFNAAVRRHLSTTTGLNSRFHVPRHVIEALPLSMRYMNAQACPLPPFQSTNVSSLGILCTRVLARHSKLTSCRRSSQLSSRRSCDVSARDCRWGHLHANSQTRKTSSALIMKDIARCRKPRLLTTRTRASPWVGSSKCNTGGV